MSCKKIWLFRESQCWELFWRLQKANAGFRSASSIPFSTVVSNAALQDFPKHAPDLMHCKKQQQKRVLLLAEDACLYLNYMATTTVSGSPLCIIISIAASTAPMQTSKRPCSHKGVNIENGAYYIMLLLSCEQNKYEQNTIVYLEETLKSLHSLNQGTFLVHFLMQISNAF